MLVCLIWFLLASWCDLGALDVAIGCSGRLKEELASCGALLMEAMGVAAGFRPLLEGDADEGRPIRHDDDSGDGSVLKVGSILLAIASSCRCWVGMGLVDADLGWIGRSSPRHGWTSSGSVIAARQRGCRRSSGWRRSYRSPPVGSSEKTTTPALKKMTT
ncbi:hypothetical protein ACLOJK_029400 [Asimina triloba]